MKRLHWVGGVNEASYLETITAIENAVTQNPEEQIELVITSRGGDPNLGMAFYDAIKRMGVKLTTVAEGEVTSAAVPLFLVGEKRLIAPHASITLHDVRRALVGDYDYRVLREILAEAEHARQSYAHIIEQATDGKLPLDKILFLMEQGTVLDARKSVIHGLAHEIIGEENKLK